MRRMLSVTLIFFLLVCWSIASPGLLELDASSLPSGHLKTLPVRCFDDNKLVCTQWVSSGSSTWYYNIYSQSPDRIIFFLVFDTREVGIQFYYPKDTILTRSPDNAACFKRIVPALSNRTLFTATTSSSYDFGTATSAYDTLVQNCLWAGCFTEEASADLTSKTLYVNSTLYSESHYYFTTSPNRTSNVALRWSTPNRIMQLPALSGDQWVLTVTAANNYNYWYDDVYYECRYGRYIGTPDYYLFTLPINTSYTALVPYQYATRIPYSNAVFLSIPQGTPVYNARDGIVIGTRDDQLYSYFSGSCPVPVLLTCSAYSIQMNYVLIEHDDGSFMYYGSLLKDSVRVRPGQRIPRGALIAKSGNTGYNPYGPVLVLQRQFYLPYPPNYDDTGDSVQDYQITWNNNGQPFIIQPANNNPFTSIAFIGGVSGGGVLFLILLVLTVRYCLRRKPKAATPLLRNSELASPNYFTEGAQPPQQAPPVTFTQVTTTVTTQVPSVYDTPIPANSEVQPAHHDFATIYGEYYGE